MIKHCDVAPVFSLSHSDGAAESELVVINAVKMHERVDKWQEELCVYQVKEEHHPFYGGLK